MVRKIFVAFCLLMVSFGMSGQFGPDIDQSVKLTAEVNADDNTIAIHWIIDERAVGFELYKRPYGDPFWTEKIGDFGLDTEMYLDADVVPNTLYEYKIFKQTEENVDGFGYILSGIGIEPTHFSGKTMLVITENTYQNVQPALEKYQEHLILDGWKSDLLIVSNEATDVEIKQQLIEAHESAPFSTCILLGDVPIPLSGDVAPDGHQTDGGAWAADLYYGDLDGIWTDSTVTNTVSDWPVNNNIPGDGKWDQSVIPSDIEIMVGRVDFSDLPVFEENEYELLIKYIEKDIAYRTKEKDIRRRAAIHNINPWIGALGQNGIRNYSTIVSPDSILYDNFQPLWEDSFLWLYAASSGFHDQLFLTLKSEELATKSLRAVFTNFFGSRFGNYDYTNNLMRSALGSGDVLSSCWVGAPHWHFHSMAMGFTLGHATLTTQNNDTVYTADDWPRSIHVNILGDPTLKLFPMEKVKELETTEVNGSIILNWPATSDAEGYYIYRKLLESDEFELLNSQANTPNTFVDKCPILDQTYIYMVRATKLEVSPSGSYYNLSTGALDTITSTQNNLPIASFHLAIEGNAVYLINSSENTDSIIIEGADQVIEQTDGSYLLLGVENGDSITLTVLNDCGSDTTSQLVVVSTVDNIIKRELQVYPIPSSALINIISQNHVTKWELYDPNGKQIRSKNESRKDFTVNISNLPNGVYLIKIHTEKGIVIRKIIKN